MARSETSDCSESSSEETETANKSDVATSHNKKEISDYEKQRVKRIEENRARMEALGLKTMAKSLMISSQNVDKKNKNKNEKKGKGKVDDDDDYKPAEDEELEGLSSSEEDDKADSDADDYEEFTTPPKNKGKKKTTMPKKSSTKKRTTKQKPYGCSDYVDDDDALLQAIALSLQDSAGFLDVKTHFSQSSVPQVTDGSINLKKEITVIRDDTGKRKRKKTVNTRVQMTEDEVILHFFQFDEAGKGNITLRDIERLATAHDFMWSDKEMTDMINCFDSDGDGKLNLDDFRKIAGRCHLIQAPETTTGKVS